MSAVPTSIEVFCSYAHEDETWLRRLETHLSLLQRQGLISLWHDRLVSPGTNWAQVIDVHLETASVILLLVSPDFLASDYCSGIEMKRALERQEAGEARVIPILFRPVDWKDAPFASLQVFPTDGKPLSTTRNKDRSLAALSTELRRVISEELPLLSASASRSVLPKIWNIPYHRNPFFTGRDEVLKHLHSMLNSDKPTTLTQRLAISGLGGIGKTQTAIEYAYRYRDDYRVVLWAKANSRESLVSDFVAIATLLKLPAKDAQDQGLAVSAVKQWLDMNSSWLIILDNADDPKMVSHFLPIQNRGHTLLTTRSQAMGTIAIGIEIEKMEAQEGTLFLLHRAKILAQDAPLTLASPAGRVTAMNIVQMMDGLPLALDQAGAYIEETACGLINYLQLLRTNRIDFLKTRGELAFEHPEPVTTTWSLAFEKIQQANPAAADLLRLCAFLAPDAIPEEVVTEGPPDLGSKLQLLVRNSHGLNEAVKILLTFSLIRRNPDSHTLTIHRLVQTILKGTLNTRNQRLWAQRAVRAINHLFPTVELVNWSKCERYLPHALASAALIEQGRMTFPEAARLLYRTGYYLYERAQYMEAELLLQQGLTIYERMLGPEHSDTATCLTALALLYSKQGIPGKYEQAESLLQRVLAIHQRAFGLEHPEMAHSLDNLALLYERQGKYEQAELLLQQALAICEQVLGPNHSDTANGLDSLAWLYSKQGKYEQAATLYQRALAIYDHLLEPDHLGTATSLNGLAQVYERQGKYGQAGLLYQRALAVRERVLGSDHPVTMNTINGLAWLYYIQNEYEQSELLYQRVIAIREQVLGPEHPDTATSLNGLAWLYSKQGHYDQAELLLQRALAIRERVLGPEHPTTTFSLNSLAELYEKQGKHEQAELLLQRALAIREQALGPEHPGTATSLNSLAELYEKQGKHEQAELLYQRALAIRKHVLGSDHPYTLISRTRLAQLYEKQGKHRQTEKYDEEAK